jgi:dTDP-D-glucose 4,6-dehydratase
MPPTFQYTSMEDGIRKTVEWFLNTENKRVWMTENMTNHQQNKINPFSQ